MNIESQIAGIEEHTSEVPIEKYNRLVTEENSEQAAIVAREIRDKLLSESDAHMQLDRLNLTMPKSILFTDWLQFLKQIAELLTGDWAQYRQALRDIPQQEGFPFNVVWPEEPEE